MVGTIAGMSVLITGGGSGIGEATARYFVAGGARVTICGRRAHKIDAVVADLGSACLGVVGDVTNHDDRERILSAAIQHGGDKLDLLVNNAANIYRGAIETLVEPELVDLFTTNVIAPMLLTGLASAALGVSKGCVVFLGSVHTQRAFPGVAAYAATKGAVESLTGVLAAELGPRGIRVGCVRPGAVLTEINERAGVATTETAADYLQRLASSHALGRVGTGREVAEAIEYLALAQWTTGAVLTVDGGLGLGVTNIAPRANGEEGELYE